MNDQERLKLLQDTLQQLEGLDEAQFQQLTCSIAASLQPNW